MRRTLLCSAIVLTAFAAAGFVVFQVNALATLGDQAIGGSFNAGGLRSFEIVPLETVSETSSNASIGDLNGDGHPDSVLVKGRHWQVTSRIFSAMAKDTLRQGQHSRVKPPGATRHLWRI